jgi:hypothetical protein
MPVCDQCLAAQCCSQIQACAANAACNALIDCLRVQCNMAPNLTTCAVQKCSSHLSGLQLAQGIQTCQQQNCAMACP